MQRKWNVLKHAEGFEVAEGGHAENSLTVYKLRLKIAKVGSLRIP